MIKVAITRGILNKRFKAIAAPITSATSVAIIASSIIIQRIKLNLLLVRARMACAKSICITIPSFAAIYCKSIAIKLEIKIVEIKR